MATDSLARALALQAPRTLAQSAVAVPHTGDTVEFTFATVTVPANAIGINGRIEIKAEFSHTGSANAKTGRIRFGGTLLVSNAPTAAVTLRLQCAAANRGVANSQRASGFAQTSVATSTEIVATSAIDTTANADITITGQLALGSETITLESYQVILYPKG